MTRIVGSKRPQDVITTTSWRDGQANVKRILNAKKAKTPEKLPGKTQAKSDKTTIRTGKGKYGRRQMWLACCFFFAELNLLLYVEGIVRS